MESSDRESRETTSVMAKEYLSKGGKEVLIKNTLSSILTYFMSLLKGWKDLGMGRSRNERPQGVQ